MTEQDTSFVLNSGLLSMTTMLVLFLNKAGIFLQETVKNYRKDKGFWIYMSNWIFQTG